MKKQSKYGDLSGQKFGRLTVVERGEDLNGRIHWWCECDCGNKVLVNQYNLIYGTTKSCGCIRRQTAKQKIKEIKSQNEPKDLMGDRFGKLTVLKRADDYDKNNHIRRKWLCLCDCGKEKIVSQNYLINGRTQSCGCLRQGRRAKDLTGQKFGKLTVLKRGEDICYGKEKQHKPAYLCKCECGTEKLVVGYWLLNGMVKSCGCSKSEYMREGIFKKYNRDGPKEKPEPKWVIKKEYPQNLLAAVFGDEAEERDPEVLLGFLPERERRIVEKHYGEHLAYRKIAETEGCSAERIRQIHNRALRRMRFGMQCRNMNKV